MDGIWTFVVCLTCFAVPCLSQDSSRTLFLISGPEVLHAGTPTLLAVTVIADFPGRVTAELVQGNTKVTQTQNFQGGLTMVLTLPPIPGSVAQNSLFNLTVRGYRNDSLIFTNTSNLTFNMKNVSTFIQTDRSYYQPGDTIKVRIVSVQLDNKPYKGRVEISLRDPHGNSVERQESTGNPGIVLQEFTLSQTSPLGLWTIITAVNGVNNENTFTVKHYERPEFEVLVKIPSQFLVGDDILGSVRALYPSGQPVHATLVCSVTLAADMDNSPVIFTPVKEIFGSAPFFFSKYQLQALYASSGNSSNNTLHVVASVTNNQTGFTVNKTVKVHLSQNIFQLTFQDFPPTLKPSLYFSAKLSISRYDKKPLTLEDLMYSAVFEVTQTTATLNAAPTTLTLEVPEDGNIHIQFILRDQVETLLIRARFQSSEETLTVYNKYTSPSGSYVQISPNNTLLAQIGFPVQINVESTFQPTSLHFVVSSRGQVVAAGTKNSPSFFLTPTLSWSPEACITVYCIRSDREVSMDTARILINQQNYVSLNWSRNKVRPGEQVSLSITTLEPKSQLGIAIVGIHDDTQADDWDLKVEQVDWQKCDIRMLTNAILYKKSLSDGPKNENLNVGTYWSRWMADGESLLWLNTKVSETTWESEKITVPDGVTSLRAVALVMSDNLGLGFTSVLQKLTVSKDFSLSLNVPSYLIRGEEIVLEVNVINHLERNIEVIVLLTQSKAFRFVLGDRGNVSVINAQKLNLGSHVSALALFPIRPVALGEMEVTVDAVSAEASDRLTWRVLVKPEGVGQFFSQTLFLELAPEKHSSSRSISFSFPPNVVPGSQRAHTTLVGDILGLSISNLDSLVQMPHGCGEQNMIYFAPSIYVLQYLDKSTLDNSEIRNRALGYLMDGYRRQLSYQRNDGSFSAFGASDTSGSTWLTAFVLRCFLQAQTYIQVDQTVLIRALTWLLKRQGPKGEFSEVGRLIHTELQGGLDNGPVALTAYVLIALLEDDSYVDMYPGNVSLAQRYLENKVSREVVSNYSLCLVAYALTLANSPVATAVLAELSRRADYRDGVMMWRSSAGLDFSDWHVRSTQIEMTSYMLLVLFRHADFVEGITLLKWLSMQRNHLGGYGTTQDTVVALQALAYYAAYSGANAIDLRFNISSPASSFVSLLSINSTTYRMCQRQEISADKDLPLNIYMEGRGFALFQMNIFYNLESNAFSQNQTREEEAFLLRVRVTDEGDHNHMLLSICTRLKDSEVIPQTGMAILEVGLLSGFSLSPGAATPTGLIREVEILPDKVNLYLDSVNKSEVCVRLPVIRHYKVAYVQDAVVQVYDYYEPVRRASRTYNSDLLHHTNSCFFCGENCDRCRPRITVISSHSMSSATCSLNLLFLGIFYWCLTK